MVHPTEHTNGNPSPSVGKLDVRPRKRRRASFGITASDNSPFQQIILEEIDLEVAIRQRIADTVQSRITWALLLQESLQKGTTPSANELRTASLDALDAIEEPCDLIFNREIRLAPERLRPVVNTTVPPPSVPAVETSAPVRSSRTRGLPRAAPLPRTRLLYIRNTAVDPPEVAKLACHVCSRSDFSSLQGLLNHCRLRHQIEYGSHDECVQSCAVLVPDEEREWVVASGIEVGGVSLPSLRRLFEIAVGAGNTVSLPRKPSPAVRTPVEQKQRESPPPKPEVKESQPQEAHTTSAHITKTLGYHIDTPALAPFLGRAPKKRCINVRVNEDEAVEIEDQSVGVGLQRRQVWRKPYAHRNVARKELDEIVPVHELQDDAQRPDEGDKVDEQPAEDLDNKDMSALQALAGTRFHINARLQIADYSLFIPPNRRSAEHPDHTHRWRLSVTSPSYSLPVASILRKVTIACASDPPVSTLVQPLTISEPPFAVTSTADKPFLARLTFTWAGTMNPPTDIEHWVELDPMHYAKPVLGDEQVFDVELDRSTELLPVREDVREASLDDMHSTEMSTGNTVAAEAEEDPEAEPEYSVKLRSLVPNFPMTLKDVKGRFSARLPYTLVNTPAQLRNMHYGRRKAIEMGRARALHEAYSQLVAQNQDATAVPLTTVDVFHWLEDEGLYPRSRAAWSTLEAQAPGKPSRRQRAPGAREADAYCHTCGLHRAFHPNVADDDAKAVDIKPVALGAALERGLCMSYNGGDSEPVRLPIFDVDALLACTPTRSANDSVPYGLGRALLLPPPPSSAGQTAAVPLTDLSAVADPQLVVAIQRMTGLPQPRSAPHNVPPSPHGADTARAGMGPVSAWTAAAAAARLAPSAALAVALRVLVRELVGGAVDAHRQDEAALRVATGRHECARRATAPGDGGAVPPRRVLAPAHVLRGLASRGRVAGGAVRVCLGRLGERSVVSRYDPARVALHEERDGLATEGACGGRGNGDAGGERDCAILPGPGDVLPEVVVKEEAEA